jgi:transcriptional regulator with XRE-family HTH domain
MTGYHTRCACPPEQPEDPERIAIREALAFGKAVYDQPRALGLSVADLARRADMTTDEIERTEEDGTEPAIALLRRPATALDTAMHLTAGHDLRPRAVRTPRSLSRSARYTKAHSRLIWR